MNVTLEDGGPCRKVLHISAPAESVRPEYQKVVAEIGEVTVVEATGGAVAVAAQIAVAMVVAATADEVVAASNRECRSTSAWPLLLP